MSPRLALLLLHMASIGARADELLSPGIEVNQEAINANSVCDLIVPIRVSLDQDVNEVQAGVSLSLEPPSRPHNRNIGRFATAGLSIELNATKLRALPVGDPALSGECILPVIEITSTAGAPLTPVTHVVVNWNAAGHPPLDGRGGGFGVPHLDIHYYTVEEGVRLNAMGCSTTPAPVCDKADSMAAEFFDYPKKKYLPHGWWPDENAAVKQMGMHWLPPQLRSVYRSKKTSKAEPPTLGRWSGFSGLLGTFNSSIAFFETMVSLEKLESVRTTTGPPAEVRFSFPHKLEPKLAGTGARCPLPSRALINYKAMSDTYELVLNLPELPRATGRRMKRQKLVDTYSHSDKLSKGRLCREPANVHLCDEHGRTGRYAELHNNIYDITGGEAQPARMCCKAMTKTCLACAAGVTVEEFCSIRKNKKYCR